MPIFVTIGNHEHIITPADLGGGGGVESSFFLRDSTPFRSKGSPFCTVLRHPFFGWLALKFFWKRLWSQNILILMGSARRTNAIFWSTFLQSAKHAFFGLFFFKVIWECSEHQFGQLKKCLTKFFGHFFENTPPPPSRRSKIRPCKITCKSSQVGGNKKSWSPYFSKSLSKFYRNRNWKSPLKWISLCARSP